MNQKQRDYLIKRVEGIARDKISAINVSTKIISENDYIKKKLKYNSILNIGKMIVKESIKNVREGQYNWKSIDADLENVSNYTQLIDEHIKMEDVNSKYKRVKIDAVQKKTEIIEDQIIFAESYDDCLGFISEMEKL